MNDLEGWMEVIRNMGRREKGPGHLEMEDKEKFRVDAGVDVLNLLEKIRRNAKATGVDIFKIAALSDMTPNQVKAKMEAESPISARDLVILAKSVGLQLSIKKVKK